MELELRFFATFREAVGQKEKQETFDDGMAVGDVLSTLEGEYEGLDGQLLDEDGERRSIRPQLSVLKNGRDVTHMDGPETPLEDGDRLSVFPPVAGG
ncbi:ubiquitin-like small modifier protein 1 [Natronorubrum daqingense]|uniref:Molybdopterin synthase sulfur carrier subunit n=1 Tax=Natronorubrum daqingense TaxID=588898 RepID=A0A1N6ZWX2_9EURY|nr:ubiquitin-like small modifier protein 1 [Natronorubrum daqingense]APX95220.1 molybdopterin synthase sulfur carrier subunit [Natronorubrum daqingense]SIR31249.1 molybdopterin synthase sulfur carrier subunit [Natronorubrum daqingense]